MSKQEQANPLIVLEPLLADPQVAEIMVDGPRRVYVEKGGQFVDVDSPFRDEAHLMQVIHAIVTPLGRVVDESHPLMDARLADGSRVNVVIPPISLVGPVLTIRKFRQRRITLDELIQWDCIGANEVTFLQACVEGRLNVAVSGGTGSGKTTLLNLIGQMIPAGERIVAVELASELEWLPDKFTRVVRLEARPPNVEGKGEVSLRDLVMNALRMRPDRIIVGEVRGGEALDLFTAMNTGHDGCMFSMHANSPRDALARLETMVTLSNPALPLLNVRQQMASAINLIVHIERLQDGTRKVLKVTEVAGMQGDAVVLHDIFEFRQTGVTEGQIAGSHTATGYIPGFITPLRAAGIELPLSLFTPG